MSAIQQEPASLEAAAELAPSPPLLRTLVACDLVESTALTEQIGDRSIADVMHLLDRHARDLVERHGGQEIDKTDGFLLMFDRPVQAIGFALDFQRLLHDLSLSEFLPLKARIGIHVGDVVLWRNTAADIARGAKPLEVEGLVKPIAARLMGLALPGQILMSGVARALALRAQDELETDFPPEWRMHGRYVFKGVAEPVPVFEVGETGIAPLRAPAYSGKAYRETPWWRRPGLLALEAAALLAAVVVPTFIFLRSPPVIAFAERDWVVMGSLKNLTEEHRFDAALDTAFQLGLEQSRYVNVLSNLKVRETVGLMRLDPEKTAVDRAVGSEVAIRNGARALIIPTVAELGRQVRVTAEVIEPHSQTTVYTESAEGVGSSSVLASVDEINKRLRERLGEALASVGKDSQPLDKVATHSLDALRAYSLAQNAYDAGHIKESMHLYREALRLDPDFAIARANFARALLVADQLDPAVEELDKALADPERLTPRDRLYVEAWRATLGPSQQDAIEKWKLVAEMYPDFFSAQSLFAYFSYLYANRSGEDVLGAAQRSVSSHNAHQGANNELLVLLYLSDEQYAKAMERVRAAGGEPTASAYAFAYAAQRQFDKAEAVLARTREDEAPGATIDRFLMRASLAEDRGDRQAALRLLDEGRASAEHDDPRYVPVYIGAALCLRALGGAHESLVPDVRAYADLLRKRLADAKPVDAPALRFQLLVGAHLFARLGKNDEAKAAVAEALAGADGQLPLLDKMAAIVRAQLLTNADNPDAALVLLNGRADGSELFLLHEVLKEAAMRKGDGVQAQAQAQWLSMHRGRAYAELAVHEMLKPLNIALSNRAGEETRPAAVAAKP